MLRFVSTKKLMEPILSLALGGVKIHLAEMDQELLVKIGQIRRRTRNIDVLEMCDVLEGMLGIRHRAILERPPSPWRSPETGRFDKKAYQREYMREYMRKRRGSKNPFTA